MGLTERKELRLPATPASVPQLRAMARDAAHDAGLGEALVHEVSLAVTEAVTNAVVHAFVGREPGTVVLVAEPGEGVLAISVVDDGRGMTPRPDSPGLGLGLPTIGRLCAQLDVLAGPDGTGTEVRMAFTAPHLRPLAGSEQDHGATVRMRRRLEGILGAVDEAITVTDGSGSLVFANEAAVELLGAEDLDEVVGGRPGELAGRFRITREDGSDVTLEDLPHVAVLAGRPATPLLTRSVHLASGRARWLQTTARPLEDPEAGRLSVNTIRDVTAAKDAERRQRFLARASELLGASLDLEPTLQTVTELAVPDLADWCAIDLAGADGLLRRVALAHRDPERVAFGEDLHRRFPPDPATDEGVYGVLRSGEPLFLPELPDELLEQGVEDPEHLRLLRAVGMRSVLLAPMAARGRTLGVLTLVTADSGRMLADGDVDLALDVARRAATAVDTAARFAGR